MGKIYYRWYVDGVEHITQHKPVEQPTFMGVIYTPEYTTVVVIEVENAET